MQTEIDTREMLLAAAVMWKLGERNIIILPEDLAQMRREFSVAVTQNGNDLMIKLIAAGDAAQPSLPLDEHTSDEVASKAGRMLGDDDSTADERSVAGSALSQARNKSSK